MRTPRWWSFPDTLFLTVFCLEINYKMEHPEFEKKKLFATYMVGQEPHCVVRVLIIPIEKKRKC